MFGLEETLKMENCTEVYLLGHSMGGAVASELAKLYPDVIKKMVLWAPAFNLPAALDYLTGKMEPNQEGLYDHGGFEISQDLIDRAMRHAIDVSYKRGGIVDFEKRMKIDFSNDKPTPRELLCTMAEKVMVEVNMLGFNKNK